MENWIVPIALVVIAVVTGVGKLVYWMGEVNTDRKGVNDFMKEIRDDVKEILGRLAPSPLAGGSPLRLTDLGKSISVTLEAKAWAERTAQGLQAQIEGKQPYEIHEISFAHVKDDFTPTDEQDARIKSCAYENALPRGKVLDVMAVELRDKLLELAGLPAPDNNEAA